MDLLYIFLGFLILFLCILLFVKFFGHISEIYPTIIEYDSEGFFNDNSKSDKKNAFPSFKDLPTCSLSVIIPAYNEETRLPPMLDEAFEYLENRRKQNFTYEIILVDDGSKDNTSKVGMTYVDKYGSDKIRVLTLERNRGKGGAVRMGMMRSRGDILLFADADGATKFSDFEKVEAAMEKICKDSKDISESLAIVCGSRAHLEEDSIAERSFFRTFLMYGFHFVVWLFTVRGIRDTQCGFKLLTRRTGRIIFRSLHIERWAFDVEMLYMAETLGIPIEEVAVNWTEIDGSKVTPVLSWIEMGFDIFLIWLRYKTGLWKIKDYS